MITLKQWLELCEYKITEGSEYQWWCFGKNVQTLDSWNGDNENGYSLVIQFDRVDQTVYSVEIHDYLNRQAYRIIHPDHLDAYKNECNSRGICFSEATDEYNFIDLDVDEDFMEKASVIIAGKVYSEKIMMPLTLPDNLMLQLCMLAHNEDVTLNEYVTMMLKEFIKEKAND